MSDLILLPPEEEFSHSLERVFLGWDHAALGRAVSRLVDHYARGDELQMRGAALVLPGARAGRRLKLLLMDEAARRRLRLVPPHITTPGTLPELLYSSARPAASDTFSRRVWACALRQLPEERLVKLFRAPPAKMDLRGWARLARTVSALHDEVSGAALEFSDVVACCGDGLLFADTERWSVLSELQGLYAAELERLGLADRGMARIQALTSGSLGLDRDLWLIGVVELPPVLCRMLQALPPSAMPVRVLIQAPEEEASGFDRTGTLRAGSWSSRPLPLRDDQVVISGRPGEQAEDVVRVLADLADSYAIDEVVVAAPNAEVVPYLEQHLTDAGVRIHVAEGMPLGQSPVVRLLVAIADYLDGGRFDACATLVRHPDLGRWLRRAPCASAAAAALAEADGCLEALDQYLTDCLPARLQGGASGTKPRVVVIIEALCAALDDPQLLGRMRGHRSLSAWMPEIMALLAEIYREPALERSNLADRHRLDALSCLRDAAAELFRLPPELDETCEAPVAIRLLVDELASRFLAPDPEDHAIEVLGWLEMRLDDAPIAIVTGFNEPYLPESVNAHAFLPNALRERLGLVDNTRRYARDAYEISALLASRERVCVVAGRRSATGDPLRPSRLLFAAEGRALAERVRRFFSESEARTAAPGQGREEPQDSGFGMPVERVLHAPEPIRRLPVTAFRQVLADPYGFALEKILRLGALDDRPRELDGLRFGNLAHAVLERFACSEHVHSGEARVIRRELEGALEAEVFSRFGQHALPAVRIQVEQLRARLHRFADWHATWVADGWRVVGTECATPEEGVLFEVDGEPFHLSGRIDRIDYHPGRREWVLFDYKTGDQGESPEETHRAGRANSRSWIDLQLPLYRYLLAEVTDAEGNRPFAAGEPGDVRMGYITIPRDFDRVGPSFAEWGDDELADADECACGVIRFLRENTFTFDPERARAYRKTPLATVMGLGYLESAADAEEEA